MIPSTMEVGRGIEQTKDAQLGQPHRGNITALRICLAVAAGQSAEVFREGTAVIDEVRDALLSGMAWKAYAEHRETCRRGCARTVGGSVFVCATGNALSLAARSADGDTGGAS